MDTVSESRQWLSMQRQELLQPYGPTGERWYAAQMIAGLLAEIERLQREAAERR
jgi:UPF0288 family protein (methanogenesis marker protein 3)